MKELTQTGRGRAAWRKWLSWWLIPMILLGALILMRVAGVFDRMQGAQPEPAVRLLPTFTPTPASPVADQAPPPAAHEAVNEATSEETEQEAGATANAVANPGLLPRPPLHPAPLIGPPPTPIPLPTATPGSPQGPDERLALGMQLHRLGDIVAARSHFAAMVGAEPVERRLRVQARYELVKSYLTEEDYDVALAMLNELQSEFALAVAPGQMIGPEDEVQNKAHFLRAVALTGLGRPAEAIRAYELFLSAYPWMGVAVQPRIAQLYLTQGDHVNAAAAQRRATDDAAVAYRRAADASTDTATRVPMLEALADAYNRVGRYTDAAGVYDEILAIAQNAGYRTQIQYQAGQSLAAAGHAAAAVERWKAATAEAPTDKYAYRALVELVNRAVDFDLYQRASIDLSAQVWFPAINAYQAYLESVGPTDSRVGPALLGLGQAYIGAGDYASAMAMLNRVLTEYAACECNGQAWLDLARAQAATGDSGIARRTYRTFAREQASHTLAPEALWSSGQLALNEGNQVEAAADFLALADRFPMSERTPHALYILGTGAYRDGLYGQAIEMYARLQRLYPDYRFDDVTYWLGRAYQATGEAEQAHAQWQRLVNRAPDTYHGVLAAQLLRQDLLSGGSILTDMRLLAGPATRLEGDDGSQVFAEQWLANWLVMDPATVAEPPQAVAADIDLSVGRLLLDLGERRDALAVLERMYERHKDNAHALYILSLEFERLEAYRLSLLAMAQLLQLSPAGLVENAPIFLQMRVYPRPFADLITQEALANNLDPLLMFSLIRQESLFEEGARSWAAAQGLAQIIPDTGAWVAEQLGYPGYDNSLIYRPMVNVKFGAYYLDWVRDYLDGNLVSALVGYNAGPGNSRHWRTLSGADDVLFVELLEINEPRIYVHTVTTNLYHYTRLYGSG